MKKIFKKGLLCAFSAFIVSAVMGMLPNVDAATYEVRENPVIMPQTEIKAMTPVDEDAAYISEKSNKILQRLEEIDGLINQYAKGWTTERMSKVDLTIIRLAVYEIKFDEDVPAGVAINEAVEIAKKFGQEESAGFVNGVLAKLV